MPLLALDFLARIVTRRIDADPLVWDLSCQAVSGLRIVFHSSSVSLFDLESRFFAPTRNIAEPARARAVKVGRRTHLSTGSAFARPYLDSSEHDGIARCDRDDDLRGARCAGADHRATTLYPVGPGPEP
jgi:hypothetical protein